MGFRAQGLGLGSGGGFEGSGVEDLGFRIWGLGKRVEIQYLRLRSQDSGLPEKISYAENYARIALGQML